MNDTHDYIFFGILLFLIFTLIAIEIKAITVQKAPEVTVENIVKADYSNFDEVRLWYLLAKKYAQNHKYINCTNETNIPCFNCVGYSTGLYNISKELGFKVSMVYGIDKYDNSTGHRWVRVSFDVKPQTGEFVNYENKYLGIEEIKK